MTASGSSGSPSLAICEFDESGSDYPRSHSRLSGDASVALFSPPGSSLWQVVATLTDGAALHVERPPGDEAIIVLDGTVEHAGRAIVAGGGFVVEAGASVSLQASGAARLAHFGAVDERAGEISARRPAAHVPLVHVYHDIGETRQTPRLASPDLLGSYYADGSCPGCALQIFDVDGRKLRRFVAPSHYHSEDEIIFVIEGTLRFGRQTLDAGCAVAVPSMRRYAFRTVDGFRFINYRASPSYVVERPGSAPIDETVVGMQEHNARR
jgi:quercetin dioxygenase-like cupin family protein